MHDQPIAFHHVDVCFNARCCCLSWTSCQKEFRRGTARRLVLCRRHASAEHICPFLEEFLTAVCRAGQMYGLELHSGKFQLLNVNCNIELAADSGEPLTGSNEVAYLGSTLSADGSVNHELCRRIGAAKGVFEALSRVWHRSGLSCKHRIRIFRAVVAPRALYSLAAGCLNAGQQRRLNGFQCRCLRHLLGIQPSFYSRVFNAELLRRDAELAASPGQTSCSTSSWIF